MGVDWAWAGSLNFLRGFVFVLANNILDAPT